MPNQRPVPNLRRRRLGRAVRELRHAAGLSLEAAAREMGPGWRDTKLSRIENANARLLAKDVGPLLRVYGVEDPAVVGSLEALARDAHKAGWWQAYGRVVGSNYGDYLTLEADASEVRVNAPQIIPGVLQTAQYAREIIAATGAWLTPDEVNALAELRMGRKAVFNHRPGREPLRLWAVLNESSLYQDSATSPLMMRDQIRHILDVTELPNITVQIMDMHATANAGQLNLFEIVRFSDPWPTVVNLDNLTGGFFLEGDANVAVYERAFDQIVAAALPVDKSRAKMTDIMNGYAK
ncbi:helix-turn-helix transcriptional regulator [Streptomyces sp. NPDC006684]|uniref:helix-turn-helix domain-containing protein n=1 Tax=Streptomyces sp. NPDC006684 TaxID=3154477 RepID=UPI003453DEF9